MRRVPIAAALAAAALLSATACARASSSPQARRTAFEDRARAVVDAWHAASTGDAWRTGFVPLQDLTVAPKQGFTDDLKVAFGSGWYRTRTDLTTVTPAGGVVAFPDGTTLPVPLVSARDGYSEMDMGDPPCLGSPPVPTSPGPQPSGTGKDGAVGAPAQHTCAALTVTGAHLGTTTLRTSRGEAVVPAWLFTVAELPAPVARVAVAATAISPVPHPSVPPAGSGQSTGLASAQRLTAVDGARLSYTIGIGACDTNPAGIAYETDDVVVIGGTVDRSTGGLCIDLLKLQPVSVTLAGPLGARVVLDALGGQPLVLGAH
jgi:hypothetical protein